MAMPWEWCCAIVLEFLFILFSGLGYFVYPLPSVCLSLSHKWVVFLRFSKQLSSLSIVRTLNET